MTYISAQPQLASSWDDICYPVNPVWLADLLPEYDIMATDRQQLIVGQPDGGRKTIFGIQSADYSIIPNAAIRDVVNELLDDYTLQIKHTTTGEFSISIILPEELSIGGEKLHKSLILTNSYNGKTPFSVQGQTLTAVADDNTLPGSSMFRTVCQNGLVGWADPFLKVSAYQQWLKQWSAGKEKARTANIPKGKNLASTSSSEIRKIHHGKLTIDIFQERLRAMLAYHIQIKPTLTADIYEHFHNTAVKKSDEGLLKTLPIPVQLAKQAQERLRFEERILNSDPSYWLMYNAVNYALFTARSSLTLNDRYKLDERVFHHLAARSFA
ncbi:MAG: hypothetical protein ABIN24_09145 [Dyadobacter sp.]